MNNPNRSTLHNQILSELLDEIQDLPLESKLPSDRQLAKRFGVALMTVNRVMNALERDGYVRRVQGKGTILAAREKQVHRDSSSDQGTVIVAVPDFHSYEYWARCHLAEELSLKNGLKAREYKLNISAGCDGLLAFAEEQENLLGILLEPPPGSLTKRLVTRLDKLEAPVVVFLPSDWLSFADQVYSITTDWLQSGYLRTKCLLDHGCESPAYIANEPGGYDGGLVRKGIRQALREAGCRLKDLIRPKGETKPWQDGREVAFRMTQAALDAGADGLICDSMGGVFGAYRAIHAARLRVPDDVLVIAGSEAGGLEAQLAPPVSTVGSSCRQEMETAFDIILGNTVPQSPQLLSPVRLTERESTGVPIAATAGTD